MVIDKFDREYEWLSNFWPCKVMLDGVEFNCVENAYQAAKSLDSEVRMSFIYITAGQAKRLGIEIEIRKDWDKIKNNIMYNLIHQKFLKNAELREKLLNTNDVKIIEGNSWHDTYWGVCNGVGQNQLGKIIMKVREKLKKK